MRNRQHVPELDGIRGIAILLVLLAHSSDARPLGNIPFGWGHHGVDLFFLLSGFLITRIRLYEQEQGVGLAEFWIKRVTRIFPAAYLCLFIVSMIWGFGRDVIMAGTYTSTFNLPMMGYESNVPVGHFWTLSVEEQFYMFWPLILLLPQARAIVVAQTLLVLFILLYVCSGVYVEKNGSGIAIVNTVTHQVFTRGWPLIAGGLFALYEPRFREAPRRLAIFAAPFFVGIVIKLLMSYGRATGKFDSKVIGIVSVQLVLTSVFALALWLAFTGRSSFLKNKVLGWIGTISYGLYLYHLPIFEYLSVNEGHTSPWLAMALSVATAAASFYLFEKPIITWGREYAKQYRLRWVPKIQSERAL